MSLSHSHANQGSPGFEKEKMSRSGTQRLARIHSPVRMCQPVSQSLSSVFTPSIRANRNAIGMRKAKSASDGSSFTANWERGASISFLGHPGIGYRLHGFQGANSVVERPEIHIIDAQCNRGEPPIGADHAGHRPLAMDTLLAKAVIGRQFYFDRNNLADDGSRQRRSSPRQAIRIPLRLMFSVYIALDPKRRRRNMAPEPDFDSRTLTPIYVFHFLCFDIAEFSASDAWHNIVNGLYTSVAEG